MSFRVKKLTVISKHWVLDDNILHFARTTNNRKVIIKTGVAFRAMEDFIDRYKNIAMAGPHDRKFMLHVFRIYFIRFPYISMYIYNNIRFSYILNQNDLAYK